MVKVVGAAIVISATHGVLSLRGRCHRTKRYHRTEAASCVGALSLRGAKAARQSPAPGSCCSSGGSLLRRFTPRNDSGGRAPPAQPPGTPKARQTPAACLARGGRADHAAAADPRAIHQHRVGTDQHIIADANAAAARLEPLLADRPVRVRESVVGRCEGAVRGHQYVAADADAVAGAGAQPELIMLPRPITRSPLPPAGLILTNASITTSSSMTMRLPRCKSSISARCETRALGAMHSMLARTRTMLSCAVSQVSGSGHQSAASSSAGAAHQDPAAPGRRIRPRAPSQPHPAMARRRPAGAAWGGAMRGRLGRRRRRRRGRHTRGVAGDPVVQSGGMQDRCAEPSDVGRPARSPPARLATAPRSSSSRHCAGTGRARCRSPVGLPGRRLRRRGRSCQMVACHAMCSEAAANSSRNAASAKFRLFSTSRASGTDRSGCSRPCGDDALVQPFRPAEITERDMAVRMAARRATGGISAGGRIGQRDSANRRTRRSLNSLSLPAGASTVSAKKRPSPTCRSYSRGRAYTRSAPAPACGRTPATGWRAVWPREIDQHVDAVAPDLFRQRRVGPTEVGRQ